MKAVVTGVAGFVGSRIALRLLAEGHSVVGVDNFSDYYAPAMKNANLSLIESHANFALVREDILETDLKNLAPDAAWIFHQAGQPGVRKSWGDAFGTYTDTNIIGTQRLLESALQLPMLQRFVYASSSSVYGDAEMFPTEESATPRPISPYGVTKLAGEHLVTLYARNYGLPTTSLRYFTVYGPGQRPDMAFTRFMTAALSNKAIQVFGSGEQIRDFTFIDDVVDANLRASNTAVKPGEIFNVAGGSSVSINQVLETLATIHGEPLRIERSAPVAGDAVRTGGATQAIEGALGWSRKTDLADGLTAQYMWVKQNLSELVKATQ